MTWPALNSKRGQRVVFSILYQQPHCQAAWIEWDREEIKLRKNYFRAMDREAVGFPWSPWAEGSGQGGTVTTLLGLEDRLMEPKQIILSL